MKSRRDKIEALLNSPNEGERAAARAALERHKGKIPERGSPERVKAIRDFHAKIDWALANMGMPGLSPSEIRTIRNLARYRGEPWSRGADVFLAVYNKMVGSQELTGKRLIEFVRTDEICYNKTT